MRGAPNTNRILLVIVACLIFTSLSCEELITGKKPVISADPAVVVYQNISTGTTAIKNVMIRNIGTLDLRIDKIAILGDVTHFSHSIRGGLQTPIVLSPRSSFEIEVMYRATDMLAHEAELRISNNDPMVKVLKIPVYNESIQPVVRVTDDNGSPTDLFIDYGDIRQGESKKHTLTIENIGFAELTISEIKKGGGSNPDFSLGAGCQPRNMSALPSSGIAQSFQCEVTYTPQSSIQAQGTVELHSNDPSRPVVTVALRAGALTNGPPVARCPSDMEVAPLDTITLDGRNSSDPDGQPLNYQWTLEQRPAGSNAPIQNANSAVATFFVDLATTPQEPYVFKLCVTDTWGESNCCSFMVHATPTDALHIQLVWDIDTSDMDLHLLSPRGSSTMNFFDLLGSDCYYMNKSPSWGAPGTDDDPSLDIDDVDGYGPENINISRPETGTFTVGVHYFCDDNLGQSNATIRIFCNGVKAFEKTRMLYSSGDFWDVATIRWPGCTINEINNYRQVTEGCQGWGFP